MKIRILTFLFFICFISCKKAEKLPNKFVGVWYDTEYIIPNKTILKINQDSTFDYQSAGCQWRVISNGKWKMIADTIELNNVKSDTCYRMFPFVDCNFFETMNKKEILTISNCDPKGNTDFLIFAKEKFYIKNDSLVYKFKPSSNCPDPLKIIFAKTQKIKK